VSVHAQEQRILVSRYVPVAVVERLTTPGRSATRSTLVPATGTDFRGSNWSRHRARDHLPWCRTSGRYTLPHRAWQDETDVLLFGVYEL